MSTQTFYPSNAAEDGHVGRVGVNEAWGGIIGGTGNELEDDVTGFDMVIHAHADNDKWQTVRRAFFMFDVSALPTGSEISGGTVSIYPNAITARSFSSSFCLTAAVTVAASSLSALDFASSASLTEYSDSRVTLASLNAATRFSFALNAAGFAAMQTAFDGSGIFKTAMVFDWDLDETTPTWAGGAPSDNITIMNWEDGSPKRPTLTVTYAVGVGNATIELTGTLANGGDEVTADMWAVEVFT